MIGSENPVDVGNCSVDREQIAQEPSIVSGILLHVMARDASERQIDDARFIDAQNVLESHDPERQRPCECEQILVQALGAVQTPKKHVAKKLLLLGMNIAL